MEKKRIVCFGDSLTWGFDLLPEDMTSGTKEEWLQALNEIDGFTLIDENEASRIDATYPHTQPETYTMFSDSKR